MPNFNASLHQNTPQSTWETTRGCSWLLRAGLRLVGWLAPRRCPACDREIADLAQFCGACMMYMRFALAPSCSRCGFVLAHATIEPRRVDKAEDISENQHPSTPKFAADPLQMTLPLVADSYLSKRGSKTKEKICYACYLTGPIHNGIRAAVEYERGGTATRLLQRFKYGGRADIAQAMALLMFQAGRDWINEAEVLVPTPLHRRRLVERGYNQAMLLARLLGRKTGTRVRADLIKRNRKTVPLGSLDPQERRAVLAGAFSVTKPLAPEVIDADILIVDDVVTTGATLEAMARAFKDAGARSVRLLAFARAPLPRPVDPKSEQQTS